MKTWLSTLRVIHPLIPAMAMAMAAILAPAALAAAPGEPGSESPKIYVSLNSLYGTALDRRHIRDFGGACETPVGGTWTLVARFRHLEVEQEAFDEHERADNVYANTFPSEYRVLGFQAAMRRHPWEWMPGFFAEAVLGYKRITGSSGIAGGPGFFGESWMREPEVAGYTNHAFETAIGFGYLWEVKHLRIALGYAFGPEFLFRKSVYTDGTEQVSSDVLELLRFNQLEVGYAF